MNKHRLLKLADLLEADAKNKKGVKFDLHVVAQASDYLTIEDADAPYSAGADCGTTACAMGLAAISGAFKRAGLSFRIYDRAIETTFNGRKVEYDRAAMRLFEITGVQAAFLFSPGYYPTEKREGAAGERYVAKRIRNLVAGKTSRSSFLLSEEYDF
jgi:hypothetical protein